ncbi:hypothetical protein AnigIFM56816_002493 [Aspergillus niger]|nr:hypothetical protein AnigIFM56816_002493 [Aspergillus niger]
MSSDSGSASDSDDKGDMLRIPRREVTDNDKELMKAAVAGFYDPPVWYDGMITAPSIPSGKGMSDLSVAKQWPKLQACWPVDGGLNLNTEPPMCTHLSDAWVYVVLHDDTIAASTRGQRWAADFTREGELRPNRVPRGPTVWLEEKGVRYFPVVGGYYVLGGDIARKSKSWLIDYKHPVEQAIVYGTATVGVGAVAEQPANIYYVDQAKWSNFNIPNATMDIFIKTKHPIIIDCLIVPNALKTKVTFVASKRLHDFRNPVMGPSGATDSNPLVIGDDVATWTRPVLKAIQGAAEMQRKIDNLATRLTAFTNELSNLNPFLIAEETVKEAMALHPNDKAGKKVVQDALRAARQG